MQTYVALLRGINVGGNNKIQMSKLKVCFESLGYKNVVTYINSGNIIFETESKDTNKLVTSIEKAIKKTFNLNIRVVVKTKRSINKICRAIPEKWKNDAEQKTDVLFLWDDFADKKTLSLLSINEDVDTLLYADGAIIWHLKKKNYAKSGMNKFIGTKVYKNMTARNVNTVRKLVELLSHS